MAEQEDILVDLTDVLKNLYKLILLDLPGVQWRLLNTSKMKHILGRLHVHIINESGAGNADFPGLQAYQMELWYTDNKG